jgi:hypothetical protein
MPMHHDETVASFLRSCIFVLRPERVITNSPKKSDPTVQVPAISVASLFNSPT